MKEKYNKPSIVLDEYNEIDVLTASSGGGSGSNEPDLGNGDEYNFPNG